jgi:hypothetical protein
MSICKRIFCYCTNKIHTKDKYIVPRKKHDHELSFADVTIRYNLRLRYYKDKMHKLLRTTGVENYCEKVHILNDKIIKLENTIAFNYAFGGICS